MSISHERIESADSELNRFVIVIPVFNDWESIRLLLPALDRVLGSRDMAAEVLLVDDGSEVAVTQEVRCQTFEHLRAVDLVRLRRNLGHQRAIAVGLAWLCGTRLPLKTVIVMDGDGEDKPEDVPLLIDELARHGGRSVVFAARTKRMERWTFRVLYRLYRLLHWLLTGIRVEVGNFSAVPPTALHRLVIVSELWNHYAASIFRSRIPYRMLPLARGERYAGRSKMRLPDLVMHGLSAISVFSDLVGVRLLAVTAFLMVTCVIMLGMVVGARLFTNLAIPGWATNAAGLLVVILIQALLLMLVLSIVTLGSRSHMNVIPLRDANAFVDGEERLFEAK